ncbi:unnamed protein product, partial [Gulo gulo]
WTPHTRQATFASCRRSTSGCRRRLSLIGSTTSSSTAGWLSRSRTYTQSWLMAPTYFGCWSSSQGRPCHPPAGAACGHTSWRTAAVLWLSSRPRCQYLSLDQRTSWMETRPSSWDSSGSSFCVSRSPTSPWTGRSLGPAQRCCPPRKLCWSGARGRRPAMPMSTSPTSPAAGVTGSASGPSSTHTDQTCLTTVPCIRSVH